jgi:hypothetical protein
MLIARHGAGLSLLPFQKLVLHREDLGNYKYEIHLNEREMHYSRDKHSSHTKESRRRYTPISVSSVSNTNELFNASLHFSRSTLISVRHTSSSLQNTLNFSEL